MLKITTVLCNAEQPQKVLLNVYTLTQAFRTKLNKSALVCVLFGKSAFAIHQIATYLLIVDVREVRLILQQ